MTKLAATSSAAPKLPDAQRPLRRLRRPLRRRDADAGAARARARLDRRCAATRGFRREFARLAHATTPAGRRRSTSRARLSRAARRRAHLPEARGPAPHRRAQDQQHASARRCVARRLEKTRLIAETGAGQHGVATATVAALFGLRCEVFMGAEDVRRQSLNVFRMKLLGADGARRRVGHAHAEGRDERGAARLDRDRRATPST